VIDVRTTDGLKLHAETHGPGKSKLTPLLCLAGLTRNAKDFEPLLSWLPNDRTIVAMDYRGRGRSDWAKDLKTYHPLQELEDAVALLDQLAFDRVAVLGTSRGGIVAMLMASVHGARLVGALLNDIGPRIEAAGLLRLARTVGRTNTFADWSAATAALKEMTPGFETLSEREWNDFARRIFREEPSGIRYDYDPGVARSLPPLTAATVGALPELWTQFAALVGKPTAVLRAEHSDFLSADTVDRMKAMHPQLLAATVAGRGHVPFLDEPECRSTITAWLRACDAAYGAATGKQKGPR
jgi:pimeloyl-ACP methyl ester carboxylesterase